MKVVCYMCKKEYEIDGSDPQYRKIKSGESKMYTCKNCNNSIKQEAIKSTGFDPSLMDPDKYDKFIP